MSEYSDFFSRLHFKWPWRNYQSRVLSAIDQHLEDNKLHIIAAPGAGKTVLGLEVFRRLQLPALVLSPTRIIRNQWLDRLQEFSDESYLISESTSTDIDSASILTSITYQSLHYQYKSHVTNVDDKNYDDDSELGDEELSALSGEEVNRLVEKIKTANIGVLILDEAHHLTAKWWSALDHVLKKIPALKLVSLTATPPYDVKGNEWLRYQSLCGVIDEEISAPELVKTGTLSPHQDFVWVTKPDQKDDETTRQYDRSVLALEMRLFNDEEFLVQVITHQLMDNKHVNIEAILEQPELCIAMLVFLKAKSVELPANILKTLYIQSVTIPDLSRRWWQVLVKSYLFDKHWPESESNKQHRKDLASWLRKQDLLHSRELRLNESRLIKSQLTLSATKLQACVDIHCHERDLRKDKLRQVILTDFIRAEDINQPVATEKILGAWPVFRQLVEKLGIDQAQDCCLITGQLCVVHETRINLIAEAIGKDKIKINELASLTGYYQLTLKSSLAVDVITRLFNNGDFHVLVGTRSLLGEGWDAPCINSLILASFVGSYVLTNQMRGRAIRTDKKDLLKTASIWHLACITSSSYSGIADFLELSRRFKTFVGLSSRGHTIENGLGRLNLSFMHGELFNPDAFSISKNNRDMIKRLQQLEKVSADWKHVVDLSDNQRVAPVVRTPDETAFRSFYFKRTLKYFLIESVAAGVAVTAYLVPNIYTSLIHEDPALTMRWVVISFAAGFLYLIPRLVKAAKMLAKHLPVAGSLRQMGEVIKQSLIEIGELQENPAEIKTIVNANNDGSYDIHLTGVSFYHQSLFADCFDELLAEIENPRYLITRTHTGITGKRQDYHAVPRIFASHKQKAEIFYRHWQTQLGESSLIYTRVNDGRIVLLRARARAFSSQIKKPAERLDVWQ